jgi:hypothetical protein
MQRQLSSDAQRAEDPVECAGRPDLYGQRIEQRLWSSQRLIADYSSGTVDTAQAVSDTQALGTALNYVSQQRVTIDNSITQVTAASERRDQRADPVDHRADQPDAGRCSTVATKLSLAETQQTALISVIASTEFDFEQPVQQNLIALA